MPADSAMARVIVTMPPALLARVERLTARLGFSRSRLIREALEQYLEAQRRQELRELLKEGYAVNAERDRRVCEELAAADCGAAAHHTLPAPKGPVP